MMRGTCAAAARKWIQPVPHEARGAGGPGPERKSGQFAPSRQAQPGAVGMHDIGHDRAGGLADKNAGQQGPVTLRDDRQRNRYGDLQQPRHELQRELLVEMHGAAEIGNADIFQSRNEIGSCQY